MIKFFRKIRQNLLMENKTGKYFKYAIGEIVLVVIGILIALQINNWNTERQNENIRTSFLKKLDAELDYNTNRLDTLYSKLNDIKEQNMKLYDTLLIGVKQHNVEPYLKHPGFNASRLNLSSSTFEQMKNTGNLHTLKSDTLLIAIETYYKLCEREDFYIMKINESIYKVSNDIHHGHKKAQLDYYIKGLDYALKNNAWLLNTESEAYGELMREFFKKTSALFDILRRIDRISDTSSNLKELIKKELENRYI
ncbi:DUF6090 family protein [Lacinutrix jangbogonensis]|uniref:DUF6090 family protein n=1 Tax=Lacinutrix jangbogonensis TaxID=1469557 RepID=UPI0012E01C1C|nr:DUF6090 family protein [Lacinutrix jangbogonensis]